MIDTNELRRLAQAAISKMSTLDPEFVSSVTPLAVLELLDRLEAAESDALEQARLNGMGSEREAALMAKLEAAEKDIAIKEEVIDSLATVIKRLDAQCDAAEKSDAESIAMYRNARDERDALRAENAALVDDMNLLRNNNTALRAKIAEMEKQAPVAWQTRTRPAWNDGTWGPWRKCSKEYAEDIKKTPSLHDWLYEARALYALPGAKGEEK